MSKQRQHTAASGPPSGAVLVVVQNGSYPTDHGEVDRLFRGDAGFDLTTRDVAVGEVLDVAGIDPRIVASLVDNRVAVAPEDAADVNAALRAEYGEWRRVPGGWAGVPPLDEDMVPAYRRGPAVWMSPEVVEVPIEAANFAALVIESDEELPPFDDEGGDDDA